MADTFGRTYRRSDKDQVSLDDDLEKVELRDDDPAREYGTPEAKRALAKEFAYRIKGKVRGKPKYYGDPKKDLEKETKDLTKAGLGVKPDMSEFQAASLKVQAVGNHISTLGTDLAMEKIIGENLKAGLPISFKRHILINCGQVLNLGSDILGVIIPVMGEGAGAPLNYAGTTMALRGQGFDKKQAVAGATHTTATSVAAGAIPGAGTFFSAVGLANDFAALCTPIPKVTKMAAIDQMTKSQKAGREMLARLDQLAEETGVDVSGKRDELQKLLDKIDYYIVKYEQIIVKKVDKDADGSKYKKYADFLAKRGLLNLEADKTFDDFLDLPTLPEDDEHWKS